MELVKLAREGHVAVVTMSHEPINVLSFELLDDNSALIVRLLNCIPGQKRRLRYLHSLRSVINPTLKPGRRVLTRAW